MVKFSLYLLILFLGSVVTFSQTIEGVIVDKVRQPIEFVNVVLYSLPDSSFVAGAVTDNQGFFSIPLNENRSCFLKVSRIGYKSQILSPESNLSILLEEDSQQLKEVVVTGRQKVFKVKNGGIVASVKNTILESLPTLNDIILQLPFVSGDDGSFHILGKGKPAVYINNRLVRDRKEIAQFSPADIDKIEVITTPGSKYDSSVKAVIKIQTRRDIGEGLSGRFDLLTTQRSTFSSDENANFNYRTGVWDIFGGLSLSQSKQKQSSFFTQEYLKKGLEQKQSSHSDERYRYNSFIPSFGVNYNPNTAHSMGLRYRSNINTNNTKIWNTIDVINKGSQYQVVQFSEAQNKGNNHSINTYYSGALSKHLSLDLNADWMTGHIDKGQKISYKEISDDGLTTKGLSDYSLYAAKGVLSYRMKYGVLEAGGEYSYTQYLQSYSTDKPEIGIEDSKDKSLQHRAALFSSYSMQIGKLELSVGLRYEDICISYYLNGTLNKEQSRIYRQLFPNILVAYNETGTQTSLSFERKIEYPTYSDLRSNVQYSTPFLYESGNPSLLPKIANVFTALVSWKDLQVMLGYTINENDILQMIRTYKEKNIMMSRPENIKKTQNANVGISYAPVIGLWRPQLVVSGIWQWLDLDTSYRQEQYKSPLFSIAFQNTFSFLDNWILRTGVMWNSGGYRGITYGKHSWQINLRLSKSLFKRKLWINLTLNDILKTSTSYWKMHFDDLRVMQEKNMDSRYMMLSISYRFNPAKNKYKGKQSSDELNRL